MRLFIVSSTALISLVLLLRTVFQGRVSARVVYAMWGLVLLRLMIPVQIIPLPSGLQRLFVPEQGIQRSETVSKSGLNIVEESEGYGYSYQTDENTGQESVQESSGDEKFPGEYNYVDENEYVTGENGIAGTDSKGAQESGGQKHIPAKDADRGMSYADIARIVWAAVAGLLLAVILFSNIHLYRRIRKNRILIQGEVRPFIYQTDCVSVPCLYGLFHPSVYLPETMAECGEEEKRLIVLHEKMHYRHWDFIWSAVRILMVCIYWFHPMVWIASKVSKRDAEYAADEAVIRNMEEKERICYGKAILGVLREGRKKERFLSMASTACSSRKELQKRIAHIAKKNRNSASAVILLLCVVLAATACSFAGKTGENVGSEGDLAETVSGSGVKGEPGGSAEEALNVANSTAKDSEEQKLDEAIKGFLEKHALSLTQADSPTKYKNMKYQNAVEAHTILGKETTAELVTVYLMRAAYVYGTVTPGEKQSYYGIQDGEIGFCAITFQKKDGAYELKEYWTPKGGSENQSSIRKKFPDSVEDEELDVSRYQTRLQIKCHREALEYLKQSEAAGTEEDTKGIQKIDAEVEMVDLTMSRAEAYHYAASDNLDFVQELVDAYNRIELVPVTNLEENSLDPDTAVTITFHLKDKEEPVQIIFDGNRVCWVGGVPHALVMNENYFDYAKIESFTEKQMRNGEDIQNPCNLGYFEIVDYKYDHQLMGNMLYDNERCLIAKFVKHGAKKRSVLNGVSYYEEYNTERQVFIAVKKQYLLAKDLGIAVTEKEAEEYVKGLQNSDMISRKQVKKYCKTRGISASEYWTYIKEWYILTQFDYDAYMRIRNISEEDLQTRIYQDLETYTVRVIE